MLDLEKISYSIGQAAEISNIAQSTLRYWETVFYVLDPHKTDGGSRRYYKKDIELILKIKDLLYNRGFTIKGANLYLEAEVANLPLESEKSTPQQESIPQKNGHNSEKKYTLSKNAYYELQEKLRGLKKILES